jgi:amino-acid N-acetyltransferase
LIDSQVETQAPGDILDLILKHSRKKLEFSILNAERGSLFQEIFTHEGCGTLVTETYENIIRPAERKDILSIRRLLAPSVAQGHVLDIDEDEVARQVDSFYVYTINSSVVAAAVLKSHGKHSELGKFCTLPRFQGKGRARELAKYMIDAAKAAGQESVFALSTNPAMWKLFRSLEMKEVDRRTLPESWAANYDFSRPSKAFLLTHKS